MPRSHGDRRQIGCVVSREPRPSQTVKPELPCTVLTACCTVARAPHPEGWPIGVGRRSPINYRRDPAGGWGGDAEPVFRQTPNLSGVVGEVNGLRGEISSLLASGWKLRLETAIGNCDWKLRLETAIGNCDWKLRLETAIGNCDWELRYRSCPISWSRCIRATLPCSNVRTCRTQLDGPFEPGRLCNPSDSAPNSTIEAAILQ